VSRRRPGSAVSRRQRLASATVLALAVASIWSGVPDLLAAQLTAARLSFADVVVLLVLAGVLFAAVTVVALLVLGEVLEVLAEDRAYRLAEADRRALRAHVEPSHVGPVLSPTDLALLAQHEDLVQTMRGAS